MGQQNEIKKIQLLHFKQIENYNSNPITEIIFSLGKTLEDCYNG